MKKTFALAVALCAMTSLTAEPTLKTVKYSDLTSLVRDNKGKVILVDFWRHD